MVTKESGGHLCRPLLSTFSTSTHDQAWWGFCLDCCACSLSLITQQSGVPDQMQTWLSYSTAKGLHTTFPKALFQVTQSLPVWALWTIATIGSLPTAEEIQQFLLLTTKENSHENTGDFFSATIPFDSVKKTWALSQLSSELQGHMPPVKRISLCHLTLLIRKSPHSQLLYRALPSL
jgi:hypothetical protein